MYKVELAKAIDKESKWRDDFYNYILKGKESYDNDKGIII
jgi:hypothetical protein